MTLTGFWGHQRAKLYSNFQPHQGSSFLLESPPQGLSKVLTHPDHIYDPTTPSPEPQT